MTPHGQRRRPRVVVARATLAMLVVVGVMSMHSAPIVSSTHEEMTAATAAVAVGGHERPHGAATDGESVAADQAPCPSSHEMIHPCMGTTSSWSAMSVPISLAVPLQGSDALSARVMTVIGRAGRAPPWAVHSLDKSVLLRV